MRANPKLFKIRKHSVTLHKSNTFLIKSFHIGSRFNISLKVRKESQKDVDWYKNMIKLSFYLSGMGKRVRRARGCVMLYDSKEMTVDQTKAEILTLLNKITDSNPEISNPIYILDKNEIKPTVLSQQYNKTEKRPLIQKIVFGKNFNEEKLNGYLRKVDEAGHWIKKQQKETDVDPTGDKDLASAIIVSLTKIGTDYLPIYTYVKAIYKREEYDVELSRRSEFQNMIERKEMKK